MYKCPKIPSPHYFKSCLLTLPLISTSSCVSKIFLSIEVNWCRSDISQYVKLVKIKPYWLEIMSFLFYLTLRLQAPLVVFYYTVTIETARASPLWIFTPSAKPGSESFSFNNIFRVWQGFSFVKIPLFKCCTGYPIYSSAPLNFLKL